MSVKWVFSISYWLKTSRIYQCRTNASIALSLSKCRKHTARQTGLCRRKPFSSLHYSNHACVPPPGACCSEHGESGVPPLNVAPYLSAPVLSSYPRYCAGRFHAGPTSCSAHGHTTTCRVVFDSMSDRSGERVAVPRSEQRQQADFPLLASQSETQRKSTENTSTTRYLVRRHGVAIPRASLPRGTSKGLEKNVPTSGPTWAP
jgi:hypothetical protein